MADTAETRIRAAGIDDVAGAGQTRRRGGTDRLSRVAQAPARPTSR
jgi:hypothetical protein